MNRVYIAVTGDLIKSRRLPARAQVQRRLKSILNKINKKFRVVVPFSLIRGDEFQGLIDDLLTAYEIAREIERLLYPVKTRLGIGAGVLSTDIGKTTAEMDGECFHRSREALNKTKKEGGDIVFKTDNAFLDESVNAILFLIHSIKKDWKEIHYRRVQEYEKMGSIEKMTRREETSYQAIWKTLKKAKYEAVKRGEETVKTLLKGYRLKK